MSTHPYPAGTAGTAGGRELDWIISRFTARVAGVRTAVVVSADGILLASAEPEDGEADRLAAVTSGLAALGLGGAEVLGAGPVGRTIVEMTHGTVVLTAISDGAVLAVLVGAECDLGFLGYHMTRLVAQCGAALTPARRTPSTARAAAVT
ncbi:roadblock/LC7 domain-containing protein [Streptomyces sp. NPDC090021]|uniref:roadblock/LC7 domain-containing protein n=1 Tax=Streptomyces sp. NPDC090021 TaxID=3365919 RepID=UPI003809929B